MPPITPEETGYSPGVEGASYPRVPQVPTFSAHASGSISVSWTASGNDPTVTYSLRVMELPDGEESYALKGYVQADGSIDAAEVWQTLSAWGVVAVTGLTVFNGYTFAVRAKSGTGSISEWCAESARMNTLPDTDSGIETTTDDIEAYFPTSANVRLDETITVTGGEVPETVADDYYGDLVLSYIAYGHDEDTANLEAEFAEYHDSAWGAWAAATIKAAGASTGDGASALATSELGTAHTAYWDGYTDAGQSENCPVKLRLRLQDEAGNWSDWIETEEVNYRNLPGELVFVNAGYDWDDVLTPIFEADMASLRGGDWAFPELKIYETEGWVLAQENKCVVSQVGWEYKVGTGAWTATTPHGIPGTATRIRYTVQSPLTANVHYSVTGVMGEVRDLS